MSTSTINNKMEVLFQGAESKIFLETQNGRTVLVKERFKKKYRNEQLDDQLTKKRIRAESKNMEKCLKAGIKTPEVYKVDLEKRTITMEYFPDGQTAKQVVNQSTEDSKSVVKDLAAKIGKGIAKIHARGIVHGDLTTSNILVVKDEIVFIDFGLSSADASFEDKGVDLYVLERALLSSHENAEEIFTEILAGYKAEAGQSCDKVLGKFEEVRARGRKRTMVG